MDPMMPVTANLGKGAAALFIDLIRMARNLPDHPLTVIATTV